MVSTNNCAIIEDFRGASGGGGRGGGGGGMGGGRMGGGGGSYFDSSVTFQFTELNQTDNVDGKVIITFV